MPADEQLRREIDLLGRIFGEIIRRFEGQAVFDMIEEIRREARLTATGDSAAANRLASRLQGATLDELRIVARAFSTFLELANLAEDRQRVRTLRERERKCYPHPYRESIGEAISDLRERGLSAADVQSLLNRIKIELVFTAHPTEAKRRSLRAKLRAIRDVLAALDANHLLPREEEFLRGRLRGELIKLWQTDFIRPNRPTVELEIHRGLSFQPALWSTVPKVCASLRSALAAFFPEQVIPAPTTLTFGTWIGGDRDGHPLVTPEVTAQSCQWLRSAALESHLVACRELHDSLSISRRQAGACTRLEELIHATCTKWPELMPRLARQGVHESYRRWLQIIRWRLERTATIKLGGTIPAGSYGAAQELADDVVAIHAALLAHRNTEVASQEVQAWIDQIQVFGFHTARLDIRQHSSVYRCVMRQLWQKAGLIREDQSLREEEVQQLLTASPQSFLEVEDGRLSPPAVEKLDLYRTLRRIARAFGMTALGGNVVSMTGQPSDLLIPLWLWKWSEGVDGGHPHDAALRLPVIPLFETIADLRRAPDVLDAALANKTYREWVRGLEDRQIVMIGYSDSTKDGGYLAACWQLYRAQQALQAVGKRHSVKLTFFHGRGGSLGRGGGPMARAIVSLPPSTVDGSMRLTEQGEILAERYDNSQIAFRHLEQILWSVISGLTHQADQVPDAWLKRMDEMADVAQRSYRSLIEHPAFLKYFRSVTPVADIEDLKIGSRPARRSSSERLEDLRAIPWVFAWTQCRCLIPAWYGLGSALSCVLASSKSGVDEAHRMYREWSFFRATIDNAVLAVAKSNRSVFHRYVDLTETAPGFDEITARIDREWVATESALRMVTGCNELLDDVTWLKRSISVRNGYVDPLNLMQAELQQRSRTTPTSVSPDDLVHVKQLLLKGIAAGMRTTG